MPRNQRRGKKSRVIPDIDVDSPLARGLEDVGMPMIPPSDALEADFPSSPPTRSASPLHSTGRSLSKSLYPPPSDDEVDEELTVECDDIDDSPDEDSSGSDSIDFKPTNSDYDPFMADSSPAVKAPHSPNRRGTDPHVSPSSTVILPAQPLVSNTVLERDGIQGSATSLNTQRTQIAPYSSFATINSHSESTPFDANPTSRPSVHERVPTDLRIDTHIQTTIAASPNLLSGSPSRRTSFLPPKAMGEGSPIHDDVSPRLRGVGYLPRGQLDTLYDMLDLDEDGVVSAQDLYSFIVLNPSSIIPVHKDTCISSPTGRQDVKIMEPSLEVELLQGKRVTDALRERAFIEFFLKMSFSILCRTAGKQRGIDGSVEDALAEQSHLAAAVPSFISRDAFVGLHSEVVRILTSKGSSYMYVVLDMPMLRTLQCFFTFLRRLARRIGALDTSKEDATVEGSPKGKLRPAGEPRGLSLKHQNVPVGPSYHGTKAAIYRMLTSWEQPRGLLQVPFLQRLGEIYLRSKAGKQDRDMQQFVRFYRHLFHGQATAGEAGRNGGRSAALANLSLLRLSAKFQLVEKGSSGKKAGERADETERKKRTVRDDEDGTFVVHSLVEPDPLSLIGSLSAPERNKVERVTFWALVRAALIGLLAALVIAAVDILTTYFMLGDGSETLADTVLASVGNSILFITDSLFNWRPVFLENWISKHSELPYLFMNSTHAGLLNGTIVTNTTAIYQSFLHEDGLTVVSLLHSSEWRYKAISIAFALLVSVAEVVALYIDTLRVAFAMGKAGGIPLLHFANRRTKAYLRREDNDMTVVRESLTRKRVRYVVTSLSKAALEDSMPTRTVLGINVHNTNLTWLHSVVQFLWPKLKRAVPTILLRVVSSMVISQYAIPFLSTPLLVLWNFLTARNSVRSAKAVILGVVAAEGVAAQLMGRYFPAPRDVIQHNYNAHKQQHTAAGCQAGEGILIRGLHIVPFHVYKELLTLITFYMQMIGSGTVHPGLHFFLVHIVSHTQLPDSLCTYTSAKNRLRHVLDTRHCPDNEFSSCDGALRDHLALLSYQWNASRQQMASSDEWISRFTDVHNTEASSQAELADLHSRFPRVTRRCKHNRQAAWAQHLMEVTFPGWCSVPLRRRWREELYPNSDRSGELLNTTGVRLMLVVGVLCVVLSGSSKISFLEEVFLRHLARVYLCSWDARLTHKYGSKKEYAVTQAAAGGGGAVAGRSSVEGSLL